MFWRQNAMSSSAVAGPNWAWKAVTALGGIGAPPAQAQASRRS